MTLSENIIICFVQTSYVETVAVLSVIVAVVVLISAGIEDARSREVRDAHWVVLGISGLVLYLVYCIAEGGFKWEYLCAAAGTALILTDILWSGERFVVIRYVAMAALFLIPAYFDYDDALMIGWVSVALCYVIFMGMYVSGIIRGGADAKCLICISIVFPVYPEFLSFPIIDVSGTAMSQIFVPGISALFWAAAFAVCMGVHTAYVNIKNGYFGKDMFSVYFMDVGLVGQAFVWPAEDVVDGKLRRIRPADEKEEVVERLCTAGYERVKVTPMIPFIVPIAAAVFMILFLGNPLFLIV